MTPERANKVLALTAWFLTSDWLSGKTTVANAIKKLPLMIVIHLR
ncbi:long-chain-fatty-acid-CoA ligase [Cutibacterium acnes JCM 18918]|nr:long-chain-fatty-acid-CoA ligase [Cutibacterium acnes JCM 18918]